MMNTRKVILSTVLGFILVGAVSLQLFKSEPQVSVNVEKVSARQLQSSVLASGKLAYDEQVVLSSELIGQVTKVLVKEGEKVAKNQVLIELDPRQYAAELEQYEAVVRQQEIDVQGLKLGVQNEDVNFKRVVVLHDKGLVGESDFIQASYARDMANIAYRKGVEGLLQARASVKLATERLDKTKIRAPMAGTVTRVDTKPGETVVASNQAFAGTSLMHIAILESMILEASVDESDIGMLKLGQTAHIFAAAYPDHAIEGTVEHIAISPKQEKNAASTGHAYNAYKVKINLKQPENVFLRPGMSCRSEIFLSQKVAAVTVPIQAVLEETNGSESRKAHYSVWVEQAGKAEKRTVVLGDADDQYQEIVKGLLPQDNVIVGPAAVLRKLIENSPVEILSGGLSFD